MSIESWKAEFYPVDADDPSVNNTLAAIRHSLLKWTGLRKDNIERHGGYPIELVRSGETCALCVRYVYAVGDCRDCPISKARGNRCCSTCGPNESDSPWRMWTLYRDPEPMIAALEAAEKWWLDRPNYY